MRSIFIGNMAFITVDAVVLINTGNDLIVEIQITPVGVSGYRFAD
jgi:hypothetical protein